MSIIGNITKVYKATKQAAIVSPAGDYQQPSKAITAHDALISVVSLMLI